MAAKIKLSKSMVNTAKKLALKGFTHKQICQSVGIGYTSLYSKTYAELLKAIKEGEHELRLQVTDAILDTMEEDTTLKIFLSKRLSLFHTSYRLPPIKSTEQALRELSKLNTALSEGEIPIELHSALSKNITEWVQTTKVTDLEKRIIAIEEMPNVT